MAISCFCGQPAEFNPLIRTEQGLFVQEPMCRACYAAEFPEKAATFELVRHAPDAGEFHDPALESK